MRIAVCVKWADLRPSVDSLTGMYSPDVRRYGFSGADEAALEVALRVAEAWNAEVVVVSCAPSEAEPQLAQFAASGAGEVRRVEPTHGSDVVDGLVAACADADLVVCGDASADHGSGFIPAALAHARRDVPALGLTRVVIPDGAVTENTVLDNTVLESTALDNRVLEVVRRLQAGTRERLAVSLPAVMSVEASVASLRRAPLTALVGAGRVSTTVLPGRGSRRSGDVEIDTATLPWRPRPRNLPAPEGRTALERIVDLTGALVEREPPRLIEADPAEAAQEIVSQIRAWGYLNDEP